MKWRKTLYNIIESGGSSVLSKIYDWLMLIFIVLSLIPLASREQTYNFYMMDMISVSVFIVDYFLRWITADLRMPKYAKWKAFLLYPITPFAIIDLLSILPSFTFFNKAFKLFRVTRMIKILRVLKFLRYSENLQILFQVLHKERRILFTVLLIAVAYIFVTALIMFNLEESEMYADFFDALYWSTVTLTTVGYGDVYPTTDIGRIISMFSALFGVAIIALPSGVITASYLEQLRENKEHHTRKTKEPTAPENTEHTND